MKLQFLLVLCLIFSGCAQQLSVLHPERQTYDFPEELNTVNTVQIGDEILASRTFDVFPAIQLNNEVKAGGGLLITCTVPSQRLVAELENKKWIYYKGVNVTDYDSLIGSNNVMGGIKIRKQKIGERNEAVFCRNNTVTLYPSSKIDYVPTSYRRPVGAASKYSISYHGRANAILYFAYHHPNDFGEITKSIIEHDVKQKSKLVIGGAEIEIIMVEENLIKYKVIKRFPST